MLEYLVLKLNEIDGKAPSDIQILPLGDHKDGRGRSFRVGTDQIRSIMENFQKRTNDLVIDYHHQTVDPLVMAPAAGWIKNLEDRGESGLWAQVEWTERGKKFIEAKEYRYLSPVLFARKKSEDGFILPDTLHSAALTNDPAIDGMVPLINEGLNQNQEEIVMKEFLLQLSKLIGLKEDATEAEVVAAVTALRSQAENPEIKPVLTLEVIEALGVQDLMNVLKLETGATVSEVKATILALHQGAEAVQNLELKTLKDKIASMEATTLVSSAMEEGKISAAQKDWAMKYAATDPQGFSTFVAKAARVVPLESIPQGAEEQKKVADETTLSMAAQFGNTEEDLAKFGGLQTSA